MKKQILSAIALALMCTGVSAQDKAYVAATDNAFVKVHGVNMGDVKWTDGFWKDRFDMVMTSLVPAQYDYFMGFSENNFKILTGESEVGKGFQGTWWQDGDYYKWLEAQISVYSVTKDPELLEKIQVMSNRIVKAIADDGYITTHTQIGFGVTGSQSKWNKPFKNSQRFKSRSLHETYNMGHFLTLATTHYRVTGDRTLLDAGIRVADFLVSYFYEINPELSDIDYNQTQIMGIMEMYRCTGNKEYLEVANRFISARGNKGGLTQNQNDTKLRKETRAVGHAVLGPVLYIGAADYAAETNDKELIGALKAIWEDIYTRKASITGGLGNVHRGGSPTPQNHNECVHEAFGFPYQIQSSTAYNETCATFYGAYYSWRLFMLTGETKYIDVMEKAFYNNLSSMQLDGKSYFYTNVLRWYGKDHPLLSLDFHQRWTEECTCVCCPTSLVRFLAQTKEYAYAEDAESLYVTLYGDNDINTKIAGKQVAFTQKSDYPWGEDVAMEYNGEKNAEFSLKLRIPKWADGATLEVNGVDMPIKTNAFAVVHRKWKKGDKVALRLPMRPIITEGNHRVEEIRGQVAVSYGPMTYCVESKDLPKGVSIENILMPVDAKFDVKFEKDLLGGVKTLSTTALCRDSKCDDNELYAPLKNGYKEFTLKMIPYYAWCNRGEHEMAVFLPAKW